MDTKVLKEFKAKPVKPYTHVELVCIFSYLSDRMFKMAGK